jgi:hypothetical protein
MEFGGDGEPPKSAAGPSRKAGNSVPGSASNVSPGHVYSIGLTGAKAAFEAALT